MGATWGVLWRAVDLVIPHEGGWGGGGVFEVVDAFGFGGEGAARWLEAGKQQLRSVTNFTGHFIIIILKKNVLRRG